MSQFTRPPIGGIAITPDDDNDLSVVVTQLIATGAGTIAVVMHDGSEVTVPFAANQDRPMVVKRVKASGTSATGIIGMYNREIH